MPEDILERKYREYKESGRSIKDEKYVPRRYGRVLANIKGGLALTQWALKTARIDQVYNGWAIELVLASDPTNIVKSNKSKTHNRNCYLDFPQVIRGETGSRFRHRYPRLVVRLDSPFLELRMKELRKLGFNSMYEYPFLVLKEEPDKDDLRKAQDTWSEMPKDELIVTKEVWQEWR